MGHLSMKRFTEVLLITMTKIFHYVNLIGWDKIFETIISNDNLNVKHIAYCDTLSLSIVSILFGKSIKRFPGPVALKKYIVSNGLDSCSLLTSNGYGTTLKLPCFKNIVDMDKFVKSYIIKDKDILIGISSPKQNILASKFADSVSVDFDIEIHCFGAALYFKDLPNNKNYFHWFLFLRKDLIRTLKKMFLTLFELFYLLFPSRRQKFRDFLNILKTNV